MRAICAALVLAVAVPVATSSAGSPASSIFAYRLTFTGSGTATAAFPPAASNTTVYTSTIRWKLIYDVSIDLTLGRPDFSWSPAEGSSVEGSSTGVAAPGGTPIQQGCERIGFSLDNSQWGATYDRRTLRKVVISLHVPGFHTGELVLRSPAECANPFPSSGGGPGCPDIRPVIAPDVGVDMTRKTQSWKLSRQCDVPDESQTEHWTGTVTATQRVALDFSGHTAQRLPLSFELRDGTVSNFVADDKGMCPHGKTSHSRLSPPPAKLDAHGRFHVAYSTNGGAYHVQLSGRVTGTNASGALSTTSRFDAFSGTLDPSGTIHCYATDVHWTAVG